MNVYIPEPTYEITYMFREVLVPFDGREHSIKALQVALDFSLRYGSRITVLHVKTSEESEEEVEKIVEKAKALAEEKEVEINVKIVEAGEESVASIILRELEEKIYNAIIVGSRGKTCIDALLHGSTTIPLALCAPCTVIIVR